MNNIKPREIGPIIIESLADSEEKTGWKLYDGILKYKRFQNEGLNVSYYEEKTKKEFINRLNFIIEKIKNENYFPLIHIEAHGYEDGIELGSTQTILWKELIPIFREINILLKGRLAITMASCFGISIMSYIDPIKRAPFRLIIGTDDEISPNDLITGYEAYFHNYFFSFDPIQSWEDMNRVIGNGYKFLIATDEFCFDRIVNPDIDPIFFNDLVIKHFKGLVKDYPSLQEKSKEEQLNFAEQHLRRILEYTKNSRDFFLMKDLKEDS